MAPKRKPRKLLLKVKDAIRSKVEPNLVHQGRPCIGNEASRRIVLKANPEGMPRSSPPGQALNRRLPPGGALRATFKGPLYLLDSRAQSSSCPAKKFRGIVGTPDRVKNAVHVPEIVLDQRNARPWRKQPCRASLPVAGAHPNLVVNLRRRRFQLPRPSPRSSGNRARGDLQVGTSAGHFQSDR